jgi:membrane protein implicated in regulation of membrane protease activity
MGYLYLAALVFGAGSLVAQLFASEHDGDHEAGGDADGDADGGHEGGGHGDALAWLLSLRFWIYGALGFGLSGSLLHFLALSGFGVTLALAIAMGVGSGALASFAVSALGRSTASSGGSSEELIGRSARVMVGFGRGSRGKVRVEVKGQSVDLLATTDEERLAEGETIYVESVDGSELRVARAARLTED